MEKKKQKKMLSFDFMILLSYCNILKVPKTSHTQKFSIKTFPSFRIILFDGFRWRMTRLQKMKDLSNSIRRIPKRNALKLKT